jgi:hypothetical protein
MNLFKELIRDSMPWGRTIRRGRPRSIDRKVLRDVRVPACLRDLPLRHETHRHISLGDGGLCRPGGPACGAVCGGSFRSMFRIQLLQCLLQIIRIPSVTGGGRIVANGLQFLELSQDAGACDLRHVARRRRLCLGKAGGKGHGGRNGEHKPFQ